VKTILSSFFGYINLSKGEEKKESIGFCKIQYFFRGSNLWILACAIVSVHWIKCQFYCCNHRCDANITFNGLIVGAGFGLGVYDFDLLKDP
jgi:hypothetical protein